MYKYKFALRENLTIPKAMSAPNILDYDFGEIESIQLEDYDNFDDFVDENIRAFEESKGISLGAQDSKDVKIEDLKEFQEFATNLRDDKKYLSLLKKNKAEYYFKQRLIDDKIANKTLDKQQINKIFDDLNALDSKKTEKLKNEFGFVPSMDLDILLPNYILDVDDAEY